MKKSKAYKRSKRTQADLARLLGLKSRSPITGYLKYGYGASVDIAERLARETKTDLRLWLQGGSQTDRQAAFDRWAA